VETKYDEAAIHLVRKQILRFENRIPMVELQKMKNTRNNDYTNEVLGKYLSKSEVVEYYLWHWILEKLKINE